MLVDGHTNRSPVWSKDGKRIVFNSPRSGFRKLWEITVGSGELRQVTTGPGWDWQATVAPNGSLAYGTFAHRVDLYSLPLDAQSGTPQRLTKHAADNFGARVSRDGRITYYSNRTGNYEIWMIDRQAGRELNITDHPARDILPDWSRDGDRIVFLSDREGALRLWLANPAGGPAVPLLEQDVYFRGGTASTHSEGPRWSPDGQLIGYLAEHGEGISLWTVSEDGTNPRPRLPDVEHFFAWYIDSKRLLYTRKAAEDSPAFELHATHLETGRDVLLMTAPIGEIAAAPDGSAVSFVNFVSHFNMRLNVLQLTPDGSQDGLPRPVGEPQQVTAGPGVWHVHNGGWAPDGSAVVYSRDEDQGDIYVIENYR